MLRTIACTALAATVLAGCSQQVNYVMSEYGKTDVVEYVEPASGETFRIFYNPGASKLMITPSLGRAFAKGATFGAQALPPAEIYAIVTASWLKSTGREDCVVGTPVPILDPQYEVSFTCPAG